MNVQPFIDCAKILIEHDETERALMLLNNLPAYTRDHEPKEVSELRRLILSKVTTVYDLLCDERELPKTDLHSVNFMNATERGRRLRDAVENANAKNLVPHIFDIGPGDATFAVGMKKYNLKFTYEPMTLNEKAKIEILNRLGPDYTLFRHPKEQNRPIFLLPTKLLSIYQTFWKLGTTLIGSCLCLRKFFYQRQGIHLVREQRIGSTTEFTIFVLIRPENSHGR